MNARHTIPALSLLFAPFIAAPLMADGPRDNVAAEVRPVPPPPTKELDVADRQELQAGVEKLGGEIQSLKSKYAQKPEFLARIADVEIYYNAVRYPLKYHEAIDPKEAGKALADGSERAAALQQGETPWALVSGPRGYISRIDESVQPYVLIVPEEYKPQTPPAVTRRRLDVSCHGRNETLTELKFIQQKPTTVKDKFVVNLYGRYCNANKFAGEIDCLEAVDSIKRQYPIDEDRILMIGFSMGGAACWQFATHYTDLWAAASPGAGFAETREFLRIFQSEQVAPPWYEQVLWHLYDCTDYAVNLANLPTIAYAGELDTQKQSSDIMMTAMGAEGLKLDRIIGPKTKHAYEKNAKIELDKRLDELLDKGRDPAPDRLRFTTWTLRYNHMFWLTADALEHHWQRARLDARITHPANPSGLSASIDVKTQNVAAFTIAFPAHHSPISIRGQVVVDGSTFEVPAAAEAPFNARFVKADGQWQLQDTQAARPNGVSKHHGLQGPIDDAFMDHFIIVRPTGKPLNEKVGAWEQSECEHAIDHWRKQFRGEAIVKNDDQVTDQDMAGGNVVLFGDPSSNKLLARMADKLPIGWNAQSVTLGSRTFSAADHVPVLIYPNPLHPDHYVVLNSGFTFREYDYLNNARQVPKLPDYAIIDIGVPPTPRAPGGIADAGFFGEKWELLPDDGKAAVGWVEREKPAN